MIMKQIKNLKFFILLNLIILIFTSCGTVREGFTNQKKNSSDEFLVEKKSPLVMPPEYNELPVPEIKNSKNEIEDSDDIKKLLTNSDNANSTNLNSDKQNKNFKNSILDKIINN